MSFKPVTCVTLHCDEPGCGIALDHDDGFIPHFDTEQEALRSAEEYDWFVKGPNHYCETHSPFCTCDDCNHTPACGYAACRGCERHAHNAAAPHPAQTSIAFTEEEIITKATKIHNDEGCTCDPKYLRSCPKFAAAILRTPAEEHP